MMTGYTLTNSTLADNAQPIMRSDGAFIPPDPANVDFQAYLAWLAAGGAPADPSSPVQAVPAQVSRRQFFQAAAQEGLITQAEALALLASGTMPPSLAAAVATLPTAEQFPAQMSILGAAAFARANTLIAALGTAMGKTSADIDALFTLAASL
jgi:hypothetical protein